VLYETIKGHNRKIIKAWIKGVAFEQEAKQQVINLTSLPFIYEHIAIMPDVHLGKGSTIGSVIPTIGAVIPAAVGVDIGCGMMAVQTSLKAELLPDSLINVREAIEKAIPHGRTHGGGKNDRGSWHNIPTSVHKRWHALGKEYDRLVKKYPGMAAKNSINHLGTLGTGNHFIEMCIDEEWFIWFMLHSGSRGCGNRIGTYFIEAAQQEMHKQNINLSNKDLAYFTAGTSLYNDYIQAVKWAQDFAIANRQEMMDRVIQSIKKVLPKFTVSNKVIDCQHNYLSFETHFGQKLCIIRKGAVSANVGELGIIPGSMGEKSFIVRGLGNHESFCSCSHGAGRAMSRGQAKKIFTIQDHKEATKNIECRKDKEVLDETPKAYKDIDAIMAAQSDLVEVVHTLKQVICVKG
jgi:tRNA-splicing ligase RtcB